MGNDEPRTVFGGESVAGGVHEDNNQWSMKGRDDTHCLLTVDYCVLIIAPLKR